MLLSKSLLGVSIVVNVALVALLATHRRATEWFTPTSSAAEASAGRENSSPTGAGGKATPAQAGANDVALSGGAAPGARSLWARLSSRDPATFAANLRAAGFSVGEARGGVYALLRDIQSSERQKIFAGLPQDPFWKGGNGAISPAYYKEVSRLWLERDRIMRSIFPEEQLAYTLRMQARFGVLAPEKYEKLTALEQDYSEMRLQLTTAMQSGFRMPWTAEKITYLEQEKRKDMAALLTPQELEQYDLRASSTALTLQRQLAGFDPTEKEYQAIYRLRAPYDEKLRAGGLGYTTTPEGAQAARDYEDQVKQAIGPERWPDYQRSTDPTYSSAFAVSQRLGLPGTTATEVYRLEQDWAARQAAIRGDASRTPEQRNTDLAAANAEARQKLTALLTPDGLNQYQLETGGAPTRIFGTAIGGVRRR